MVSNDIVYKGFIAYYNYNDNSGSYIAKVINSNDTILCDGKSPKDVRKSLIDSIDLYLDICTKKGLLQRTVGR